MGGAQDERRLLQLQMTLFFKKNFDKTEIRFTRMIDLCKTNRNDFLERKPSEYDTKRAHM